jgi:hypothetical protein
MTIGLPGGFLSLFGNSLSRPAACCASAKNRIKIHESEFLYHANRQSSPDNRDFLDIYAKNPQVQQAVGIISYVIPCITTTYVILVTFFVSNPLFRLLLRCLPAG